MYLGSMNDILTNLVRILNMVRFEFQIQTLFFYLNQNDWHLFCNSKSYIQVYLAKFTFVKIKSRRNFGEFIIFSQSRHNSESCSECSRLVSHKNWKFLEYYEAFILILQVELVLGQIMKNLKPHRTAPPAFRQWPPPRPRLSRCHRSTHSLRRLLPPPHAAIKSARRAEGLPLSAISVPTPQHRSASSLPPLCAGKPSPMCNQVECPSRHRPELQP
jgi:hypothetical protein